MPKILCSFTPKARNERPGEGPLVIPNYKYPKPGEKEEPLGKIWVDYLKLLNPDPKAQNHLFSEDYGPTKGFNKNNKLIWIHLTFPGNVVMIDKILGNYARIVSLNTSQIPDLSINYFDHPHLIHRVFGSNSKKSIVSLSHAPLVPILSNGRWIDVRYLWRIDTIPTGVVVRSVYQGVYAEPTLNSLMIGELAEGQITSITSVVIGDHGLWGKIGNGWIQLRYKGKQMTNWKV